MITIIFLLIFFRLPACIALPSNIEFHRVQWDTNNHQPYVQTPNLGVRATITTPHKKLYSQISQTNQEQALALVLQLTSDQQISSCFAGVENQELFSQYHLYSSKNYLGYIRKLPGYEQALISLQEKIQNDKKFKKQTAKMPGFDHSFCLWWENSGFHDFVNNEAWDIRNAQDHRKKQDAEKIKKAQERRKEEGQHLEMLSKEFTAKAHVTDNHDVNKRLAARLRALEEVKKQHGKKRDYSALVKKHAPFTDEYADVFNNCYGTALDQQLHEELCDTRVNMMELVAYYQSGDYPDFYVPIVYRCTALAKEENNLETAFSLSDYSDALVKIVSRGMQMINHGLESIADGQKLIAAYDQMTPEDIQLMTDIACGTGRGVVDGVQTVLTPEHWISLVTNMPTLVLRRISVLHDLQAQSDAINKAFIDGIISGDNSLYEAECKKLEAQNQLRMQSIKQTLRDIASLSAYDFARHAAYFGTTLTLESLAIHAGTLATSSVGRSFVSKIATALESPKASQTMVEVADIGKIAVEKAVEGAHKVVPGLKQNHLIPKQPKQSIVQGAQELRIIQSSGLKSIGENIWQSPGGVIYGSDRKFGNTLNHTFAHLTPNSVKNNHTVFIIPKEKIVGLIDEAWIIKGSPIASDSRAYVVDMKRVIGTNGETAIRIVVKEPGTAELLTAYPVEPIGKI